MAPPLLSPLSPLSTLLLSWVFLSVQSQSSTSAITTILLPRSNNRFSVTDYGAIGDGNHYDTQSIQAAIDDCSAAGGGLVRFPGGNYLTATIYLRSRVVLEIEKGATILGGTSLSDYPRESRKWYVVLAENATDVGITGGGVIDGQGLEFIERVDPRKNVMVSWNSTGDCYGDECRPRLVGFIDCRNVKVWDVRLTDPAYWWLVPFTYNS